MDIEADIYISIERVQENSQSLQNPFEQELRRVMIHGILHLVGYSDKTKDQKLAMRKKEDSCLSLYFD
jgi:rRNA maturation RNase YbeY